MREDRVLARLLGVERAVVVGVLVEDDVVVVRVCPRRRDARTRPGSSRRSRTDSRTPGSRRSTRPSV